jgi:hypothetical protein
VNQELKDMLTEKEERMEQIWEIVKTWDYKTYRQAQMMFAPVEQDEE